MRSFAKQHLHFRDQRRLNDWFIAACSAGRITCRLVDGSTAGVPASGEKECCAAKTAKLRSNARVAISCTKSAEAWGARQGFPAAVADLHRRERNHSGRVYKLRLFVPIPNGGLPCARYPGSRPVNGSGSISNGFLTPGLTPKNPMFMRVLTG